MTTKGMPRDLLVDPELSGCRLDIGAHNGAQTDWLFPALGSSAVGIGRPQAWGLAAFGQLGVEKVLDIYDRELRVIMRQAGTPSIASINAGHVVNKLS